MVFLQVNSLGHTWTYGEDRTPKYGLLALPEEEIGMKKKCDCDSI